MRIAIKENFCKGCMLCITFCPKKVIQRSGKMNEYGYLLPKIVNPENCVVCRNCELYCPEFAVSVER